MNSRWIKILIALFLFAGIQLSAQPKWKKSAPAKKVDLELFRATMLANFPTTEMLKKGDFEFEISHRFSPAINDGFDNLFGFDGPVRMRIALGYGLSDRLTATFGRSNIQDNWDLQLKYKLLQIRGKTLPSVFALRAGVALNTEIPSEVRGRLAGRNFQYYAQLIYNTMLFNKKLGIGIVPSYLQNSAIFTVETQYTFTIGSYYQYYFNNMWSLWVEQNSIVTGYQGPILIGEQGKSHNHIAVGFSLETGGHLFHIFLTNNVRLNPSQFIVGSDRASGDWRIGFGITRHL